MPLKTVINFEGRQIPVEYKFNYAPSKMPHVIEASKCIEEGKPFLLRSAKHENGAVVIPTLKKICQIRNAALTHISESKTEDEFFIILGQQIMAYDAVERLADSVIERFAAPPIYLPADRLGAVTRSKKRFGFVKKNYIRIIKWAKRLIYKQETFHVEKP